MKTLRAKWSGNQYSASLITESGIHLAGICTCLARNQNRLTRKEAKNKKLARKEFPGFDGYIGCNDRVYQQVASMRKLKAIIEIDLGLI